MKLTIARYQLEITPESAQDEAWLEEVLELRNDGDSVPLTRVNAPGLSRWAFAEAHAPEERNLTNDAIAEARS